MTQTTGWRSKAIHNTHQARKARNAEIARLKAERVDGTDLTPAEHLQIQRDLKAAFLKRHPEVTA